MSHQSIAAIASLTGMSRELVARRLKGLPYEDGPRASKMYDTVVALPKLYVVDDAKTIDLTQARAVLATKQSAKIDLDMELRRGDFVPRSEAKDGIIAMLTAFRSKMLGLPTKAVPRLKVAKNEIEQEQIILELTNDALKELKVPDILEGSTRPNLRVSGGSGAATKTNRK